MPSNMWSSKLLYTAIFSCWFKFQQECLLSRQLGSLLPCSPRTLLHLQSHFLPQARLGRLHPFHLGTFHLSDSAFLLSLGKDGFWREHLRSYNLRHFIYSFSWPLLDDYKCALSLPSQDYIGIFNGFQVEILWHYQYLILLQLGKISQPNKRVQKTFQDSGNKSLKFQGYGCDSFLWPHSRA